MQHFLRSVLMVFLFAGINNSILPQVPYASTIIEYHPAPGQFINNPYSGTPAAAAGLAGQIGNPVSLGGYGGYIIFGFNKPIKNNPLNPFGIDFIIVGNAMENISEQGIVLVMKDENKNGLPDDTWYEIKGSDHFLMGFRKNYRIRYENPGGDVDIPWSDNFYSSGTIRRNEFHTQVYYPLAENFPALNHDSLIYTGSLLPGRVTENNGQINSERSFFGYADNTPFRELSFPFIPDNPYTIEIEGSGGDGIDISWSVNEDDNYVNLDEIDFVKIYTGVNLDGGWLGEVSTEVSGIAVVSPVEGTTGPLKMIMPMNLPLSLPVGSNLTPDALVFQYGRPLKNEKIIWESSNPFIADFNNNTITSYNTGYFKLSARLEKDLAITAEKEIYVFKPAKLSVNDKTIAIRYGEVRNLPFKIFDQLNNPVPGSSLQFHYSDSGKVNVVHISGSDVIMIEGLEEGQAFIDVFPSGYEDLLVRLSVNVFKPLPEISCLFSMRYKEDALIPRHPVLVTNKDFSGWIDRKPDNYAFPAGYVSLASVISEALSSGGFSSSGNTFRYRIDEKGYGSLYLWQLVRNWEYVYGWGGSLDGGAYNSCWVVTINGNAFMNSFDKIPVAFGDVVSLNYVKDITAGFNELIIRELDSNDPAGGLRKFRVVYLEYSLNGKGGFTTSEVPLPNEKILVISPDGNNTDIVFTDPDGYFTMQFENSGIFRIIAENYPGEEIQIYSGVNNSKLTKVAEIVVFPNPVEEDLYIKSNIPEDIHFVITDITGKSIIKGKSVESQSDAISVNTLLPGTYIIRIQSGEIIYNYRFIKK